MTWILGLNLSHNGSICITNGHKIVAIQEERLNRKKRSRLDGHSDFNALNYCFKAAKIVPENISMVVYSVQGNSTEHRNRIELNENLYKLSQKVPFIKISHHFGHAASTYYGSGFPNALIIVIDGMGSPYSDFSEKEKSICPKSKVNDWEHVSVYFGKRNKIIPYRKFLVEKGKWVDTEKKGMPFFASIGGMYSAVSKQIFGDLMDCGKVMGLAPFGTVSFTAKDFFEYKDDQFIFNKKIPLLFNYEKLWPNLSRTYKNLAASVQNALNQELLTFITQLIQETKETNICLSGGIFLNCIFNEIIHKNFPSHNFYIPPAPDDSGVCVGNVYYGMYLNQIKKFPTFPIETGISYKIKLHATKTIFSITRHKNIAEKTAVLLSKNKYIGWFQGGSELGPRALGYRSILVTPSIKNAKQIINSAIKFREDFRPFAPSILEEEVLNWFELSYTTKYKSPFMQRLFSIIPKKVELVPAIVHIDGSSRLQTVSIKQNPIYYKLIKHFFSLTGLPLVLNTSFNTMGEPIVETPLEALICFLFTSIDACIINNFLIEKPGNFDILNLKPRLNISLCENVFNIKNKLLLHSKFPDKIRLQAERYWSKTKIEIDVFTYILLFYVDSKRNGWDIFTNIQKSLKLNITQFQSIYRKAAQLQLILFKEIDISFI